MTVKQWLDAVERHLERKSRPYEQRYIARLYDDDNTDETAAIVAKLILDNTRIKEQF